VSFPTPDLLKTLSFSRTAGALLNPGSFVLYCLKNLEVDTKERSFYGPRKFVVNKNARAKLL
jgi:hypothetical protein